MRKKPDVTAPDGGNTTFFGLDVPSQIDTDEFPNFFGTSVAAITALVLSVRLGLSPSQIEERLKESAVDIRERTPIFRESPIEERTPIPDGEGDDRFSGAGLIRADRAVRSVLSAAVAELEARAQPPGKEPAAPVSLR